MPDVNDTPARSQTTLRRIANAKRTLQAAGWTVLPPSPPRRGPTLDQCQYPDLRGEPGDTCTHSTSRSRTTKHGWLWLFPYHYDAPLSELFDKRVSTP